MKKEEEDMYDGYGTEDKRRSSGRMGVIRMSRQGMMLPLLLELGVTKGKDRGCV